MSLSKCKMCAEYCNITASISKKEMLTIRDYLKKNIKLGEYINANTIATTKAIQTGGHVSLRCFFRDPVNFKCLIYNIRPKICRSYKCWVSKGGKDKTTYDLKSQKHMIADILQFPREIIFHAYLSGKVK